MLNSDLQLAPDLFTDKVPQSPTRAGMGEGLAEIGEQDERVVALCADLTESTRILPFAEKFPTRFIQVGIAEQNLVTVAAGLAAVGKIPFASSYAAFMPGRCWEQIRTTICYNQQNVKLIGSHAGLLTGPDGATHQMLEDLALMRSLPNMIVMVPCDSHQAKKMTVAAAQTDSPVYIRLAREKTPEVTTAETPFEIGKAQVLRHGQSLTLISTGPVVYETLWAGEELDAEVINLHTIKPFDVQTVVESVQKTGRVVTVEEHQINGGLGGAVAEVLMENYPVPMKRIGMYDRFGESGEPKQLIKHFGLDKDSLVSTIKEWLNTA